MSSTTTLGGGMLPLIETSSAATSFRLSGPSGVLEWHERVVAEVATHLSPAHAAVFARPVGTPAGWLWVAPGAQFCALEVLPVADRRALVAALGVIISDIRRLGESNPALAVAAAGPALLEVPSWDHVFAVDGRPVLAGWGHIGMGDARGTAAGLVARLDDGVRWTPPSVLPWPLYRWALLGVALLALLAGGLVPLLGWANIPAAASCQAVPDQLKLMREQNEAAERGQELKRLLSSLDNEIGDRQLQCPIRRAPSRPVPAPRPAPTPLPTPAPTPAPPQHAELPQDRWDKHDLSLLEGCWTNTTPMNTVDEATRHTHHVKSWKLCFDRSGHGQQTILWEDGSQCKGPLAAKFTDDNQLTLTDTERCALPHSFLYRGQSQCRRESDVEAQCDRVDLEGFARGSHQQGNFHR